MHFKTLLESISKFYWNAFQNSIGKHLKLLLECISKLYWKASQNFIGMEFKTLLESRLKSRFPGPAYFLILSVFEEKFSQKIFII